MKERNRLYIREVISKPLVIQPHISLAIVFVEETIWSSECYQCKKKQQNKNKKKKKQKTHKKKTKKKTKKNKNPNIEFSRKEISRCQLLARA